MALWASTPRSAATGTRNVHFGTAEELKASMGRRHAFVQKAAPHPDIVDAELFPTVTLVPTSPGSRALLPKTPLSNLRERLQRQNATKQSTSEHEYLVMLKGPTYAPGQEPSPADLTRLRAPESMIRTMTEVFNAQDRNPRMSLRVGGRLRLPIPTEEPLVKIMTGLELLKLRTGKERQEKETARREKQEKEVEITWTIKDNDLVWSLNRIKQWLSEGTRVTVSLTRKRRWLAPPDDVCQALITKIREAVSEVQDVRESNISRLTKAEKEAAKAAQEAGRPEMPTETLRGFGTAMTLSFVPKAKPTSLSDAVDITVPWLVADSQLKQYLKAIGAALKKGRNVRIELNDSDGGKVKGALAREEVFQAIRSECRQAKDVRVKNITGNIKEEASSIIFEVMGGVSKGFLREIEVPANLSSKDAELRLKWIDEWIKQGLEVTVWADPSGIPAELETALKTKLTLPIVKAEEADSHGQKKFVVAKDKTAAVVDIPEWKPVIATPSRSASSKQTARKSNQASAANLLQNLEGKMTPTSAATPAGRAASAVPARGSGIDNPFGSSQNGRNGPTRGRMLPLGKNSFPERNNSSAARKDGAGGIHELLKSMTGGASAYDRR